ncbi:MAG: hypothetical protein H5U21_06995 [Porphyrobacter sp.]|nr:hypothetical protein [Porphyrobacter sp.]
MATDFAIFFTALLGAALLTRYLLDRVVNVGLTDLIETAIAAALIAVGRAILGGRG